MKKSVIALLSIVMALFVVLPSQTLASETPSFAKANEIPGLEKSDEALDANTVDFSSIKKVEKYVSVDSNGHIVINSKHSKSFHKKYDLDQLQEHFNFLNEKVDAGTIKINEDLSIEDLSISLFASYSKWTYHWWGYDRNFTNAQANRYVNELNTAGAAGTMAAGAASLIMPIVGAGVAVSSGYYYLLSARVAANNKGKGVYVGMTWARVFNVKSL